MNPITEIYLRVRKSIQTHVSNLKADKAKGAKISYRTLADKTGLKFGSGIARKYRRAHATRVMKGQP
jgi:hypothetical protein